MIYYFKRLLPFILLCLGLELVETGVLIWIERTNIDYAPFSVLKTAAVFSATALTSCIASLLPVGLYLLCLPKRFHGQKLDRYLTTIIFFGIAVGSIFEEVAELIFWQEFTSRFNFIAVDYLIYTTEVIGNIAQSYPLVPILSAIFAASLAITMVFRKKLIPANMEAGFKTRVTGFAAMILFCVVSITVFSADQAEINKNRYNVELSKEGVFALFSAFVNNELSYQDFYLIHHEDYNAKILRENMLASDANFIEEQGGNLAYEVTPEGPERKANVIIVLMESMGYEFFKESRPGQTDVTPELSKLGESGLYFSNVYANGTRTVRGIEAVTLSVPPLPGMSIVRRKGNGNLYSVGSIFQEKGYETKWIYGGYGYFDNMNAFFAANNFQVVDRTNLAADEVTFSNAWGVCDEDLFNKALKEADDAHARKASFMQFVLTTSNHRPYTYPEGRIDIPSKTGRDGAVKYADYAIGAFVRAASQKPWFGNTVFMFVADHGAGSSGREEINPRNHKIPVIIYAPAFIKPQRVSKTISQIDATPTLLAQLNLRYTGRFYGMNALDPNYKSRFFLSNYQKLDYSRDGMDVIMRPVRQFSAYREGVQVQTPDAAMRKVIDEAVASYQHAANWRVNLKREQPVSIDAR